MSIYIYLFIYLFISLSVIKHLNLIKKKELIIKVLLTYILY